MTYYTSQYFQTENEDLQKMCEVEKVSVSGFDTTIEKKICEICQKRDNKCLLTCSICYISVHSDCYSVEEQDFIWKCEKCTYLLDHIEEIECKVCKKSFGGLKKKDDDWVHPVCKVWPSYENFLGDKCSACNDSVGNIIACGTCWKIFHPYCGVVNGLKCIDWNVSCSEHFNEKAEIDKETINSKGFHLKRKYRRRKTKKLLNEVKDKENKGTVFYNQVNRYKENESVGLCKAMSKIMKIRKRGPVKEILKRFEDYLFLNSTVTSESYVLSSPLSNSLGLTEVPFNEVSDLFFRCCDN